MSDFIIPLLKTNQRLLVSLRIKPCMTWVPVYPTTSPYSTLPLAHSISSHLASFCSSNTISMRWFQGFWTCWTLCLECYSPRYTRAHYFSSCIFLHRFIFSQKPFFITKSLSVPLPCFFFIHIHLFICFPPLERKLQKRKLFSSLLYFQAVPGTWLTLSKYSLMNVLKIKFYIGEWIKRR